MKRELTGRSKQIWNDLFNPPAERCFNDFEKFIGPKPTTVIKNNVYEYLGRQEVKTLTARGDVYMMELDLFNQTEDNGLGYKATHGTNLLTFGDKGDVKEIELFDYYDGAYRHTDRVAYDLLPLLHLLYSI